MSDAEHDPSEQQSVAAGVRDLPGELEAAIQHRAYEISQSADAGSPEENWRRAEVELSAGAYDDSDAVRRDELAAAEDEEASVLLHARMGALGHP